MEEVPKTQEWGGECCGRWQPLRRKNCFSEAELGEMVQSRTRRTASWGSLGQEPR